MFYLKKDISKIERFLDSLTGPLNEVYSLPACWQEVHETALLSSSLRANLRKMWNIFQVNVELEERDQIAFSRMMSHRFALEVLVSFGSARGVLRERPQKGGWDKAIWFSVLPNVIPRLSAC